MEQEELNRIWEDMENPPKGVKVKKRLDKIIVQITIRDFLMSMCNLLAVLSISFIFGAFIAVGFIFGYNDLAELTYRQIDYRGITLPWNLILIPLCPFLLFILLRNFLWAAFGKIELVFGSQNYISQRIFMLGKKKDVNWEDISSFYVATNKLFIINKDNKIITFSAKYLSDVKSNYLFSIIKYFKDQNNAWHRKRVVR